MEYRSPLLSDMLSRLGLQSNAADDRIVSVSFLHICKIWTSDGTCIATLKGGTPGSVGLYFSALFNPSGDKIITTVRDGYRAEIWSRQGRLTTLVGHSDWLNSGAFNAKGDKIITTSSDNTTKIWLADGTCIATIDSPVGSAKFNRTSDKIVLTPGNTTAEIWQQHTLNLSLPEALALSSFLKTRLVVVFEKAQQRSIAEKSDFNRELGDVIAEFFQQAQSEHETPCNGAENIVSTSTHNEPTQSGVCIIV